MSHSLHIRFERSDGMLESIPEEDLPKVVEALTIGPYEWVQLTYEQLRVSPNGEVVAMISNGDWILTGRETAHHTTAKNLHYGWSDVVIY